VPELNHNSSKKNVLVAPLDWGLGHATRCIPLIKALLSKNYTVLVACSGPHKMLLKIEFPELTFIDFPGYDIHYSKKFLAFSLLKQTFKIRKNFQKEHKLINEIAIKHHINWIISDNRYGCYSTSIPSTFITHQLRVKLPPVFRLAEPLVQRYLYKKINQFSACWVPDLADEKRGMSGDLGHPAKKPFVPVIYIGWLTRFARSACPPAIKYNAAIILSGPEPQRSLLEALILEQLQNLNGKYLLIRGLPGKGITPAVPSNVEVKNHLSSGHLQTIIEQSAFIVARTGYSTLMDMFTLQKKCILIPTPGQTEQEYLGKIMEDKKMALVFKQSGFALQKALEEAQKFDFHFPLNAINNLLEMAIDQFAVKHL
jgi:UDP:flavonoid glycosyltransferase YjiC (YdhE family)